MSKTGASEAQLLPASKAYEAVFVPVYQRIFLKYSLKIADFIWQKVT
jgi:hypothetical protein